MGPERRCHSYLWWFLRPLFPNPACLFRSAPGFPVRQSRSRDIAARPGCDAQRGCRPAEILGGDPPSETVVGPRFVARTGGEFRDGASWDTSYAASVATGP